MCVRENSPTGVTVTLVSQAVCPSVTLAFTPKWIKLVHMRVAARDSYCIR